MTIFLGLLLSLFCFYPSLPARPFYEAMFGLFFLSIVISNELKKIHWIIGLNYLILSISAIYTFFFPHYYPIPVNPIDMARDGGEVLYSFITLTLFTIIFLIKDRDFFERILELLFFSAVADSFVMIFMRIFMHESPPYAMLNNGTADACFISCMIPYSLLKRLDKSKDILFLIVMCISIILSKSNTAIASLGVGLAASLFPRVSFKKFLIIIIPSFFAIIFMVYFGTGSRFLQDSGRAFVYRGTWEFFKQFANPLIGFGTGTFTVWGLAWQKAHYMTVEPGHAVSLWLWLHQEELEILFENGIVGLISVLIMVGFMFKKLYSSYCFPILCVYFFTSLTEMPLRLWVTQLLGICLMAIAFKSEEVLEMK